MTTATPLLETVYADVTREMTGSRRSAESIGTSSVVQVPKEAGGRLCVRLQAEGRWCSTS